MTTKVNPYMQRGPGKVRMGNGQPFYNKPGEGIPALRIVIEIDPHGQGTSLRTEGPLTIPVVIDVLLGQLTTLWARWMTDLQKQKGIVDPKTGLPLAAVPVPPQPETPVDDSAGVSGEPKKDVVQ